MNARDRIRQFLREHVGEVVTSDQVRQVALGRHGRPISEWARRLRELRDEEGMRIRTHTDRPELKPGEYLLESLDLDPAVARSISGRLRIEILERNGFTCQLCGAGPNEPDPVRPGRRTRLVIDHLVPVEQGGTNDRSNLRVVCSACNAGRANMNPPGESVRDILARIRRLPRGGKAELFTILRRSFSGYLREEEPPGSGESSE